jgi:hypothetical protein
MVPDDRAGIGTVIGPDPRRRRRLSLGNESRDRDGAAECDGHVDRSGIDPRQPRDRAPTLCAYGHAAGFEADHDRPIEVCPQDARASRRKAVQCCLGRMTVRIAGPGRGHGDTRSHGVHERLGRGCLAPVMGDLEQVDLWQAIGQELGIDRLLDVAHQQEATRPDQAEQDDRHVVDAGPAIRRLDRHLPPDRPQDTECDLVDLEAVARGDATTDRRTRSRQALDPGGVSGPGPEHAWFEDSTDTVAIQQHGQAGDVVLVWMAEDHRIDSTIPRRDVGIERHQQQVGVGTAIDQQPPAARPFDQDPVPLADIEDGHASRGSRTRNRHSSHDGDRDDEGDRCRPMRRPADGG